MFLGDPWLDLARRQVDLAWIRTAAARELFRAVLEHGETLIPGTDLELSDAAFRLWDRIRTRRGELATQAGQSIFDGVWQTLAARPLIIEYLKLQAQLVVGTDLEKSDIMSELKRRKQEISQRFPLAYEKWMFRRTSRTRRPRGRT